MRLAKEINSSCERNQFLLRKETIPYKKGITHTEETQKHLNHYTYRKASLQTENDYSEALACTPVGSRTPIEGTGILYSIH